VSVPCGSLRFTRIGADWGEEQKVSVPSGSGSVTLATLTRAAHALGRKIKIDLVPAQHKIPRDDRTQKRHEGANSVCPLRFNTTAVQQGSTGGSREMPSVWEAGVRLAVLVAIGLRMEVAWVIRLYNLFKSTLCTPPTCGKSEAQS